MGLKKGTIGPDPGHYNARSSVGPQATSNRPNAPAFTQPKRERLKDDLDSLSRSLPPPSKYGTGRVGYKHVQRLQPQACQGYHHEAQLLLTMKEGCFCSGVNSAYCA
eukprot:1144349-Pelagomonas_calceolata.AAC.9